MRPQPLRGVRIADFTTAWAGPRLTTYLAELGANVIHVESIQYLDEHRIWRKWGAGAYGTRPDDELGTRPWERLAPYPALNKGKLGITLNLHDRRGQDLLGWLIAVNDVLVDNYRTGQLTRFGTSGPYHDYTARGDQAAALAGMECFLRTPTTPSRGPV
jgi:crotonobetainyl-CoA:carnitine CoA-transferase CaiB-like acyl-CoA transferase